MRVPPFFLLALRPIPVDLGAMFLENLTIISGGQTGVDRAALDWAIRHNIPHAGWCPQGRWAEDGPLPANYQLRETPSNDPAQRTEWNVRDSDGTAIFSLTPSLAGGSLHTLEFARRLHKPWCHLWRDKPDPVSELQRFLEDHAITKLNIAGPRASEEPEAATFAVQTLEAALLAG